MNEFFVSVTVGFLCTLTLFAVCFLIVLGGKVIFLTAKRYMQADATTEPVKHKTSKAKPSRPTPSPVVKSIEIDPLQIDRIYVKKSS